MESSIRQPFNDAQIELLKAMSYLETEQDLKELKFALSKFFADRADREMDSLWDEGKVNDTVLEQWSHEHMRTPYNTH